ncbi:DNA repair protein RadA [Vallitalea longa]|uniref:DNA repair protein RadA n=1 Tax=Vallitalea longa TaxID=2936439 RepID=A0A9W6DH86_9FIRM|nr:DNA repair protein RadA [Vallitalea longa]GKX31307.1 DNA repair protein RadA [Vallitalea longa]
MAKQKSVFVCQECGNESAKWMGQCPACKQWNTFVEEIKIKTKNVHTNNDINIKSKPKKLSCIEMNEEERLTTNIGELDRVLGGGIVKGSLTLVGGDPGIGKSTLLLQMCQYLCDQDIDVLYISGEESLQQIKMRGDRLGVNGDKLTLYTETNLTYCLKVIKETKPSVVIVDSIQTIYSDDITSAAGSVSQVREVTAALMKVAKGLGISTFIVGHVTKEGAIAGPRVLEHMVDTVLYFEGVRSASYRILRAVKNRFGSTNEIGVFEMRDKGLEEVPNPSEYMLTGRPINSPGSIVTCCMEGTRPMLVEVQALTSPTNFGMPRRTATGTDYNRVVLLMAVLEKKIGMQLASYDSYVNIAGGLKITEPSLDLGIVCAIASSFKNIPVDSKTVIMGEVGLTGEVRGITMAEKRILESKKLGFKKCIISKTNVKGIKIDGIEIIGVNNVAEALNNIF